MRGGDAEMNDVRHIGKRVPVAVFSRDFQDERVAYANYRHLRDMCRSGVVRVLYNHAVTILDQSVFLRHDHHWCDTMLAHMTQVSVADYYFFMEYDGIILRKGMDTETAGYMRENGVDLVVPGLRLVKDEPHHQFAGQFGLLPDDCFSMLAHFCISRRAILHYLNTWDLHPRNTNWMEIDLPNLLRLDGFRVEQSPFIMPDFFKWVSNGSLTDAEIRAAISVDAWAIHPVKSFDYFNRIFLGGEYR